VTRPVPLAAVQQLAPARRTPGIEWGRLSLRALALGVAAVVIGLPVAAVFTEALHKGLEYYLRSLSTPEALAAIRLTLLTAAIAVPINTIAGIAAAWLLARFRFRGRSLLVSLIDLPFAVSPVIAGLVFVLLCGRQGLFGPWILAHGIRILFAPPAVVLATLFVTFPFVAREVLAVLELEGKDEEEAALTLGASGPQVFLRVTLPKIRWAALYGVVLCNARAMGEFGAVSVVSGHVRGQTNTIPLHAEILYNEYDLTGAFAAASLLTLLALLTLAARRLVAGRSHA
jgi:sulfate/thiosulfate transport system permease protein